MVKKILICLSVCLLLLVGVGVYALDITDDEERGLFTEII